MEEGQRGGGGEGEENVMFLPSQLGNIMTCFPSPNECTLTEQTVAIANGPSAHSNDTHHQIIISYTTIVLSCSHCPYHTHTHTHTFISLCPYPIGLLLCISCCCIVGRFFPPPPDGSIRIIAKEPIDCGGGVNMSRLKRQSVW